MGAITSVLAFDFKRHTQQMVPALQALLKDGKPADELQSLLDKQLQQSLAGEARHKRFYLKSPRWSEQLKRLEHGLGLDLAQVCLVLDQSLGLKYEELGHLADIQPSLKGGCKSQDCPARRRCPFHPLQQETISAELVMQLFQQAVRSSSLADPEPLSLGRNFQLYQLSWWYGNEIGLEYDAAEKFFLASSDPLALLLARLCKRAAIWGWRDGGSGEGLLGWLSPQESYQLADQLEVYQLAAQAEVPDELDAYLRETMLPAMRMALSQLQNFALSCHSQGLGILLIRE